MQTRTNIFPTLIAVALAGLFLLQLPPVDAEEPGTEPYAGLYIDSFGVSGVIDHHYAITELTQHFINTGEDAEEARFQVKLPARAFISNFSLKVDGVTYYAVVMGKDKAQEEYANASAAGHNTALLESADESTFQYSVTVAAGNESTLTVRYEEFLERRTGYYNYELLLSSVTGYYSINEFSIDIDITSGTDIQNVEIPDAYTTMQLTQHDAKSYSLAYSDAGGMSYADATISYRTAPTGKNGVMLTDGTDKEGYFLHLFSPQQDELGESPLDKEIIFVLDSSGSMSGTKISQLKSAFGEIIQDLLSGDTFNLVVFDSDSTPYEPEVIEATQTNMDDARSYINNIEAGGSTNIDMAMGDALDMVDHDTDRMRVVVLLTDGQPTAGETNTWSIRQNVLDANTRGTTVFTLGFGYDLDYEFIEAMALENGGKAFRIEETADAASQMTDFYASISVPLLSDITFIYPHSVHGVALPDQNYLFEGSELAVLGKYAGEDGSMTATVRASASSGTTEYQSDFDLGGEDNSFIPRLWAYKRIMSLLDDIKVEGQLTDLTNTIVDLAINYSFVTPYTSLFIDVPQEEVAAEKDGDTDGDGVPDAEEERLGTDAQTGGDPAAPPPDNPDLDNGGDGGDGTSPSYYDPADTGVDGTDGAGGGGAGDNEDDDGWWPTSGAEKESADGDEDGSSMLLILILAAIIIPIVVVVAVLAATRKKAPPKLPDNDTADGKREDK